ncbi:MAG: Holliday junction branch migration protein RuvA [Chthonomonas sp.]|nr:Holliday junction branch migration protein RuvA [Chthonomonas sp.]
MIVRLRGEVIEVIQGRIVVDCNGVGYEALVPESTRLPLVGERADLFTRHIIREDAQFLVGFVSDSDRRLFDLLTEVKGCGPKISLQIISDLGTETTLNAIAVEDPRILTKATGVGPRLAERIVVELKEKVRQETFVRKVSAVVAGGPTPANDELVEALMALGYRRQEAETAATSVSPDSGSVEERLRLALQRLAK